MEAEYGAFYTGGRVEWTSDGSHMLCQCSSSIKVVDLSSGLVSSSLNSPEEEIEEDTIYTFSLSRDSLQVVTAHKSGLLKLWSLAESKIIKMWRSIHKGPISRLAFNGTGDTIATGGSDGTARLWNIAHQTCMCCLRGAQGVFSILVFHPDTSKNLIFGSADDTKIRSWETEKGLPKHVFSGHFSKITSLNFTYDGSKMVSSGRDRVLILWDIDQGKAIRTLPVYESLEGSVILPIKFQLPDIKVKKSSGGVYVACAGEKGTIKVWDVSASKLIYTQENSVIAPASEDGGLAITQLLFNDVRCCLSAVSADHNIIISDLATFDCSKQMVGFTDEILDLVYIGQDDSHAAVATNSPDIKVYELASMNCRLVRGHTEIVLSLARSTSNPDMFLSAGKDNTIRLWLMKSGTQEIQCLGIGTRHTASVGSVSLPSLCASFCLSVSQDTTLKRWQLPSALDATEPAILTSSHTEIAHSKDINCVSISPNDRIVATGSQDKTVKLWSAEDLSLLGTLRGHKRGVWCARFSPVDQVLLTTSADCTMKLWSLAELNCLKTFEGHDSSVLRAEFLSRGLQIVSTGADGLLKVWNIKTSECSLSLDKHDGKLWALAVSQDESTVMTGGADSLLIKWKDVTADKKLKESKEREELALQEQELSNLLQDKKLLKALKLALRLDKPYHVLRIVNEITKDDDKTALTTTIKQLSETQQDKLLQCCVEWNTNTKNCQAAQVVVNSLLAAGVNLTKSGASSIRALLPYTQRHMQRLTGMLQDLHFLQYTTNCMQPHGTKLF